MRIRRFSQRLLVANLCLFFVTLVCGGSVAAYLLGRALRADFERQQLYRVEKMRQQLDAAVDQLNRLTLSIVASRQIQRVFQDISPGPADYFLIHPGLREEVRDALFSFTAMRPLTGRICLVSLQGDLLDLSNQQDTRRFDKAGLRDLVSGRLERLGEENKLVLPPQEEVWSERGETVITVLRPMQDTEQRYGYLEVNQKLSTLEYIWGAERVALYDLGGKLLWSAFPGAPERMGAAEAGRAGKTGDSLAFRSGLDNADWQLALFADTAAYWPPVRQGLAVLGACQLLIFLVSSLFSWVALGRITRPVRLLTQEVRGIIGFDSAIRLPSPKDPEEVQVLGQAFTDLLKGLKEEHEATMVARNQELAARMAALQAQMNPHFIFNTLMCIAAYGRKSDGDAVFSMCTDLSAMLRYTLENPSVPTTIGQELSQARVYLALMGRRFHPYFSYEIGAADRIEAVPVPRLLLQPILENCFVHGFADRPGPWRVDLTCRGNGSTWSIEVRDNGRGIEAGRVQELLEELDDQTATPDLFERDCSRGRLGLLGTVARLRSVYGAAAVFSIETPPEGGCLVRLGVLNEDD